MDRFDDTLGLLPTGGFEADLNKGSKKKTPSAVRGVPAIASGAERATVEGDVAGVVRVVAGPPR